MTSPTKEKALELLHEHVQDTYQRLHSKMVASALEKYAELYEEDKDLWYITGILHDLDYYEFPDEHPNMSLEWFKEWNYPDEIIHAVKAHAFMRTDTKPQSRLAKALIACDELSGFLYAYSLMRPTGFEDMKAKSVIKKFKDKAFAAKIDRNDINYGVTELGVDFKEHIDLLISIFKDMPELKKGQ
jgi:putative nucleotidyltransferase with HDIG domain